MKQILGGPYRGQGNSNNTQKMNTNSPGETQLAATVDSKSDLSAVADESVPPILMSSPPMPPPVARTTTAGLAPQPLLPQPGNAAGANIGRTKLRKKRGDASRRHLTDGTAGAQPGGGSHHPSEQQQQQQQQSLRRRIARARWSVLMLLPALMVFLFRAERVEVESHHLLTVGVTCSVFALFALTTTVNEMFGRSHFTTYAVVWLFSFMWGSVILAIRDLTAARLGCMVWFGFCSGNMRYHWDDDAAPSSTVKGAALASLRNSARSAAAAYQSVGARGTTRATKQSLMPLSSGGGGSGGASTDAGLGDSGAAAAHLQSLGYSSGSTNVPHSDASTVAHGTGGGRATGRAGGPLSSVRFPSPGSGASTTEGAGERRTGGSPYVAATGSTIDERATGAPQLLLHDADANMDELALGSPQVRWSEVWHRSWRFCTASVWRKVGLGLCATLGEVIGCAANVPNSWSEVIAVSWLGYAALILAPIVVYKCASWVSHVLVLLCGSRVNTADASRMLFLYWVVTTVLSLGTLIITVVWLLTSIVPYIWALQVLVTPYSILFELIAFESKEYRAANPYKDVAEVYREHIHDTMEQSREYFVH